MIQQVAKDLDLDMLWVGGRGKFKPSYGEYVGWVDKYRDLPKYYNKLRMFVSYPFNLKGYSEQFNYTIAEAMSCGLPVVTSDNGSIESNFGDSPAKIISQRKPELLKQKIWECLELGKKSRNRLAEEGRQWVKNNLSLKVIGKKLVERLEEVA